MDQAAESRPDTRAIRGTVKKMRRSGKTFNQISAQLGLSVSTVRYYARTRNPKRSDDARVGPRTDQPIPPRRLVYAKALAEGKTGVEAALEAGSPNRVAAHQYSRTVKADPRFEEMFTEVLNTAGLTVEELAKTVKESTLATKIAGIAVDKKTGLISDKLEVPDYHVRHQAARTGFELHKKLGRQEQDDKGNGAVTFLVRMEDLESFQRLTGGPLAFPVKVIDMKQGEPNGYFRAESVPDGRDSTPLVGQDRPEAGAGEELAGGGG